jgi:hypothetical protein
VALSSTGLDFQVAASWDTWNDMESQGPMTDEVSCESLARHLELQRQQEATCHSLRHNAP